MSKVPDALEFACCKSKAESKLSPEGLAIIDLDSPYSPPRRLSSHGLPWLVVDVQWSPFASRDYWVVSTANHRCLVWNLNLRDDSSSGAIEHSLHGHSRAITDINFSAHHPDYLATCAVDGYVHCWDLRRPKQPALSFCDWFAGATQVKYNRQDSHILASSHDRWLHIWDDRKPSQPLKSISAHTSKIYGLDWNRTSSTNVVTCSLDKSIKFWDYAKADDVAERIIRTEFPVWRARHTPFGHGLLAMPQNEPGHLYLFDQRSAPDTPHDGTAKPVATFQGHGSHKVKEFLWRSRGGISDEHTDNREFQLVSWGEDNELRLTRPEPQVLEQVGYVTGSKAPKNLFLSRKGATYKTFRTVDDGVHHRRTTTMSDQRTGSGPLQYRQSALTLGMKAPSVRSGVPWKGPSMKAKTTSRKAVDRSQAQMSWMRGITMTKRKSSSESPQRTASKDSSMFGSGYQDDQWGEPETIQEEFVRISTQLPNVKWESIDMDTLILNASLKGPWGIDGEPIFINVKVDIPLVYPKLKAPKFIVEKNAFMPSETHTELEHGVHRIAHQYLRRKQNCLAAAFSYLLGEADLETSTSFFKNVRDLDDGIDALADESSSEDSDNDIPAGGSAAMSQDLTASTEIDNNTLAPSNRPVIPPLIRTTGARFSSDGRLICFFPTKEAKALLFSPNDTFKERPKGEPTFAGFGRLTHDSPPPRPRYLDGEASTTDDLSAISDESDNSSSSSDSELTTMSKISLWYRPGRRGFRKSWSAADSVRSSGCGTGAGTGTGTGTSRRRVGRPKNIVSFYDMRDMLPSKQQFAEEYAIFGDGARVCEHNAQVADRYGCPDLVNIWRYSALLLRSDIPLELHEFQRDRSILVIAKDALSRHRDNVSRHYEDEQLTGRVKWGHHPLAQDFVNDLFEHFEQLADVQMLAMLSCIFGESSTEDSVAYAESHLTQPETPLPMKAPSFSLEYFPTDTTTWNLHDKSQVNSAATTPRTAHTPVLLSDPTSPDDMMWVGEPSSQSYSTGETPPQKFFKDQLAEGYQTQSLSSSPNGRSMRRSHSAFAQSFSANFPRAFTAMKSSSPPGRKRPSPAETMMSNLTSGHITWGGSTNSQPPPRAAEPTGTARTSISDDDYRQDELVSMIPVSVSVVVENETAFDDDGWLATPLLEPSRNPIYASYRYAYAEMLQMWGLPLARLEIMKFNVLKEDGMGMNGGTADSSYPDSSQMNDSHSATGTTSPTVLLGGKREQLQALHASGRGLDVTGICRIHEIQLNPVQSSQSPTTGGAVGTCERCKRTQTQLLCVFCHEPINSMYTPCLNCGCASHDNCLAEWHAAGETECPAGDECDCVEEANKGQVETWTALRAVMANQDSKTRRATTADSSAQRHHGKGQGRLGPSFSAVNRLRRRSAPSPLLPDAVADIDSEDGVDTAASGGGFPGAREVEDEIDRGNWESVASVPRSSSLALNAVGGQTYGLHHRPSPLGPGAAAGTPMSAARVSLGALKSSIGEGKARPPAVRRKSGDGVGG